MKSSTGIRFLTAALFGCTLSAAPALAQQAPAQDHGAHGASTSGNPVMDDFRRASEKMHRDMGSALTGDADWRDLERATVTLVAIAL